MRRRLLVRLLSLLLCAATAHSLAADTYPRQPGVDALHYVFRVGLTDLNNEIAGESTVTLRFTTAGVKEIALDMVKATGNKGMRVSAVACGGSGVPFTHDGDRLRITLTAPPSAGDELSCTTTYRGVPAGGLRIINNIHGERTAFSENWPNNARHWLPMLLEVGISLPGAAAREGRFTFPADAEPIDVTLDPNTWVLMEAPTFAHHR
jgi:hypothetical protein